MLAQRSLLSAFRGRFAARSLSTSMNALNSTTMSSYDSAQGDPSLELAKAMPLTTKELDNNTLVTLSVLGNLAARKEIVKRHIMSVDHCDYSTASKKFDEIENKNLDYQLFWALPYKIGIAVAVTAGFSSFPLVYVLDGWTGQTSLPCLSVCGA